MFEDLVLEVAQQYGHFIKLCAQRSVLWPCIMMILAQLVLQDSPRVGMFLGVTAMSILWRMWQGMAGTVRWEQAPRIIAINGYAGTGKDTIAEILRRRCGAKCHAFADALRTIAGILNPIVAIEEGGKKLRYNDAIKKYGYERCKKEIKDFRPFLVNLGKFCRENISPTIWMDIVLPEFNDEDASTEQVRVYTDARNKNECDRAVGRGGLVIQVQRKGVGPADEWEANAVAEVIPDVILYNNGTKAELEDMVIHAIKGNFIGRHLTGTPVRLFPRLRIE